MDSEEFQILQVGDWSGRAIRSVDEEITFEEQVSIRVDSTNIFLDSIGGLNGGYKFVLEYPEYGLLTEAGEFHEYSLSIQRRHKDSLVVTIYDIFEEYEFRLKKDKND